MLVRTAASRWSLVLSILTLVSGFASGQQTPPPSSTPPPPGSRDFQARYEPPSGPGVGQAYLKTYEGEWTVQRNFYPPNGGPVNRATGECTQKMIQDGRFLQSDFTFHQDGKSSTGTGISGFDPKTGLFTTFWFDSRSTRVSIRQSRDPFDGKQIVLYSVSLGGSHGQEHVSRTVSHLEDGGPEAHPSAIQFGRGGQGARLDGADSDAEVGWQRETLDPLYPRPGHGERGAKRGAEAPLPSNRPSCLRPPSPSSERTRSSGWAAS